MDSPTETPIKGKQPAEFELSETERVNALATIILEIIEDEGIKSDVELEGS